MIASKNGFPFPLQLGALDWFAHPRAGHVFERPVWHEGCAVVANCYIALRVHRGHWDSADFPAASREFLERFEGLPWGAVCWDPPDEWRALDDIRGTLYRDAPVTPWTDKHKCAPSRVWWVNGCFLARLSHLQLIARLPRCEVHCGVMAADAPLLFRFSGGLGMLAADARLTTGSFSIFEPVRHEDGARVGKRQHKDAPVGWVNHGAGRFENWPPVDETDKETR